ncbi:MAG: carbohydrate ABC transporter permease, partial [Proteobacteria bacterium]|nr:carbohydrate ABC transporter permease [Pseudomonadota bacterium]
MKKPLATTLLHIMLLGLALVTLTPMVWMLSTSFMSLGEASVFPPRLLPEHATAEHYLKLFTQLNIGRYFLNSAITAVMVTTISLLLNSLAG